MCTVVAIHRKRVFRCECVYTLWFGNSCRAPKCIKHLSDVMSAYVAVVVDVGDVMSACAAVVVDVGDVMCLCSCCG